MERIDDSIRVSLHLNPEDVLPIPEYVEFPWYGYQWNRVNYEQKVRNDTMEAMETFELPAENAAAVTENRCYTVEDLQIILGISRGTVYKLLEQKEFRWMKIGTAYRISKKNFDAWLDEKFWFVKDVKPPGDILTFKNDIRYDVARSKDLAITF